MPAESGQITAETVCCPPDAAVPLQPPHGEAADEALANLTRALGHPARVRIVRSLLKKNVCIAGELAEDLPLAASTVSQHLKVLKEAGIIKGEVAGPRRCYCIDHAVLGLLKSLIGEL